MSQTALLIIVEIPEDKKVICQAAGCGRSVYRRVHVVKNNNQIEVYGEDCSKRLFGKLSKKFTMKSNNINGAPLTERDVELLTSNTKEFILEMERKYAKADLTSPAAEINYSIMSDEELMKHCLKVTKEKVRKEMGLNPDLPGWIGMVKYDAKILFDEIRSRYPRK